jgi:hypothetical protein
MSLSFPTAVYVLCFITSATCAFVLARSYLRTRARLLLWSALCFFFLSANNLLLIVDLVVLPDWDLRLFRHLLSLAALVVLLFGFIWNSED